MLEVAQDWALPKCRNPPRPPGQRNQSARTPSAGSQASGRPSAGGREAAPAARGPAPSEREEGGKQGVSGGPENTERREDFRRRSGAARSANAQPRSPPRGPEPAVRGARAQTVESAGARALRGARAGTAPDWEAGSRSRKLSPEEEGRKGRPSEEQSRHQRPGSSGVVSGASAPLRVPSTRHPFYAEVSERKGLWSDPDPAEQRASWSVAAPRTRTGSLPPPRRWTRQHLATSAARSVGWRLGGKLGLRDPAWSMLVWVTDFQRPDWGSGTPPRWPTPSEASRVHSGDLATARSIVLAARRLSSPG